MIRRRRSHGVRRTVAVLAMLLNVFVAASSSPPQPETNTLQVGIAYGDTLVWMSDQRLAQALDDAVDVGATWIRADISWDRVQHNGPTRYEWALFDRVMDAAGKRGLRVLPETARLKGFDAPVALLRLPAGAFEAVETTAQTA